MFARIADGRTDLVFDHIAGGGPATASGADGVSLIEHCAYYGDVSASVSCSPTAPNWPRRWGPRLNAAAFHGHWRLCEFLLENGAAVDRAHVDTGETPLHAALCKANRPTTDLVVRVLLAHGADPNRTTQHAVETGCFMRDIRTRAETPLHRAAAYASAVTIERLLDAGAVIDARDTHGDTPLTWASAHLRPDAILRLLCHDGFSIHPERDSRYDHGAGWGALDLHLLGRPHGHRPG